MSNAAQLIKRLYTLKQDGKDVISVDVQLIDEIISCFVQLISNSEELCVDKEDT